LFLSKIHVLVSVLFQFVNMEVWAAETSIWDAVTSQ